MTHQPHARPSRTRRAHLLLAFALLALYLAVMSGHLSSMDGLFMARQGRAFALDRSLQFQTPVWTWRPDPVWNSNYGIGLSLLYVPGMLAASAFGLDAPLSANAPSELFPFYMRELYDDPLYTFGGAWVHAVIVAAAAYLVARLVLELGGTPRASLWGMAFYGIGSSALVYARGDFSQPLEGLCWIAALLAAVRVRRSRAPGAAAACAIAVAYAIVTRPIEGVLLAPAVLALLLPRGPFAAWRLEALRPALLASGGALAGIAVSLLVNSVRFGNPLQFGYGDDNGWVVPAAGRWAGALLSPGRGIVWEFPALLLVLPGLLSLAAAGRRREAVTFVLLPAALFVNTVAWYMWWGGWCWGLRLFMPAIPLLAAIAGLGVDRLRGTARTWLPAVLLLGGLVWALPGTFTDILAGYPDATGEGRNWTLAAYPPVGAWRFVNHLFALAPDDVHAVDVLWLRLARSTGGWSLAVPAVLIGAAVALSAKGLRLLPPDATPLPASVERASR